MPCPSPRPLRCPPPGGTGLAVGAWALMTAAGCGGGSASNKGAEAAHGPGGAAQAPVAIGDLAASQGGLSQLGGGRNRETTSPMAGALRIHGLDAERPVKLDGMVKEWPAFTGAQLGREGKNGGHAFAGGLQYDDARLYAAGEITDDRFVRTARFGAGEDHASLVLALPAHGGGLAAYEIGFFAGKPGESAGSVRFLSGPRKGQEVSGAKIIEAPTAGGYTFEASVPWTTFPEAKTARLGMRGILRYVDVESVGATAKVLSTGPGDVATPRELPALPTEPEAAVVEGILGPRGLDREAPSFDLIADVAGDGLKERVTVYGSLLTVCGPGYRGGKQFFYRELAQEIVHLEARDLTGRGKEDLVVRLRGGATGTVRETFQVWSFLGGDEPSTTFAHEIAVTAGKRRVSNVVHVTAGRDIEVAVEPAVGWDIASYREPLAGDGEPVLFPWGGIKARTFRFDGKRFAKASEITQTPQPLPPGVAPPSLLTRDPSRVEPPTPVVKKGSDLSADLLDLFRKERGIPDGTKPRFDLEVQVAEDPRPERVVLFGRDLVVFGPGFRGGQRYAFLTLSQFTEDAGVKDLSARDVAGTGTADLVVRGTRKVTAAGSPDPVEMDALFVYQVQAAGILRVFGIETGREQGKNRIQGMVQFVPASGGKGFEIDVRPGRAFGWTEKTYPWGQESAGAGGLEPLLLPWGDVKAVRYAWNGTTFARKD